MTTEFMRPALGIRPVIDGRCGGIRESLEEQTVQMAKSVAAFLAENVRYADGEKLRCVVSPSIGGVYEVAAVEEMFRAENVCMTLSVTPSWAFGSETIDMDPQRPKAIWGFNGTERSGAVYLAAALAAANQKGLPTFGIYGRDVQDKEDDSIPEDVQEKLLLFARGALAVAEMRGKSYLSIGSVCMGIMGSYVDETLFQNYLGMRNEYVDMSELARRMKYEIYDPAEFAKAMAWVEENCPKGEDPNPVDQQIPDEQKQEDWATVVKMTLIVRDLVAGNPRLKELGYPEEAMGRNAVAAGFQGQRHWNDFMPSGDFTEAMLCSSFDWNGIRAPYVVATENDNLNAVSMLFGNLLTRTAQCFADIRTYWSPEAIERVCGRKPTGLAAGGLIHLKNSGAVALDACGAQTRGGKPVLKPHWEITDAEADACLKACTWHPANREFFAGGGYSSKVVSAGGMPVTLIRLNLVAGLGPALQLAEGYTVELPRDMHDKLDDRTDNTWPTAWFAPNVTGEGAFTDGYTVMNSWGANHGSFSYGHIGAQLITLASMLRIPVSMHNVPGDKIFRPAVWNAFGADDLYGSDYRACANFGGLYR